MDDELTSEKEQKVLEQFILNNPDLDKLEGMLSNFNVFENIGGSVYSGNFLPVFHFKGVSLLWIVILFLKKDSLIQAVARNAAAR